MLDALEMRRGSGEVGGVGDLEEKDCYELTGFRHDRVERGELAFDTLGIIDAFGAQRLLEGGPDRLAVLEHQRERVAEVDPPRSLELGDAMPLVAASELVRVADADVAEVDPGRSFRGHGHLHQLEAGRRDS